MQEAKKALTDKRIEISEIKSKAGKFGQETKAVIPKKVEAMFAGKMCLMMIRDRIASSNAVWAYVKQYGKLTDEQVKALKEAGSKKKLDELLDKMNARDVYDKLVAQQESFNECFIEYRKKAEKIIEIHPLWDRFKYVKGFTSYQLGLLMACIKDISRFDTASSLMVYSGLAVINGMPVTKANLNKIKKYYSEQGKEFKGFNTILSGRMFVIVENLLRAKGYFFEQYQRIRSRLAEKALNEKRIEIKDGKEYMKDKNNQSLIMYTHKGASRRIARNLLHLLWTEWRKLEGLPTRVPYPIEYLGHTSEITLDEVIKFDEKK